MQESLNDRYYAVLDYISKRELVTISDLYKDFDKHGDTLIVLGELQVSQLIKGSEISEMTRLPDDGTGRDAHIANFRITPLGRETIEKRGASGFVDPYT